MGDFIFGGGNKHHGGSANPYASVQFGHSQQRTSEIFGTLDPVWPHGETMFMDVSLPIKNVAHSDPTAVPSGLASISENNEEEEEDQDGNDDDEVANGKKIENGHDKSKQGNTEPEPVSNHHYHSSRHTKNHLDSTASLSTPQPILTVALFSASEMGKFHKSLYEDDGLKKPSKYNPSKPSSSSSGDSDDAFLGMAAIDLTTLLTGKRSQYDAWVPLMGHGGGSVRIVCEYETTDIPPAVGDKVQFTRYCHPADLYPLVPGKIYTVDKVVNQDHVVLSYTSPEGWLCSFVAHRFQLICTERHQMGLNEACREELHSITEKLAHSPLVGTLTETVERLPEEGLFKVGASVVQGGVGLLGRWWEGGWDTAIQDVAFATNIDGRFSPGAPLRPTRPSALELEVTDNGSTEESTTSNNLESNTQSQNQAATTLQKKAPPPSPPPIESTSSKDILPNMPSCPITGEPMEHPVVAADGHTYERAAIARWLQASDKSPLTGSVLPHKELVPNYGLLSTLQEQADKSLLNPPPPLTANISTAIVPDPVIDAELALPQHESLAKTSEVEATLNDKETITAALDPNQNENEDASKVSESDNSTGIEQVVGNEQDTTCMDAAKDDTIT